MRGASSQRTASVGDLDRDRDVVLAARVLEGDKSAEDELTRLFQRRVLLMVRSRIRDAETARDLTQEVLLAVLLALRKGQLRDGGKLAAFVYGTARNVVNGFIRSKPEECLPLCAEVVGDTGEKLLEELHQCSLVARLLSGLDAADRQILALSLLEGLRPGEIAERLGLSPEAVRARKSRAIKRAIGWMNLNVPRLVHSAPGRGTA
jgi:RNA polymerase sigma factor (sigma-70 family)